MFAVPNHRRRDPVVSVYLASQEQRMYSICVPSNRDWTDFYASIRSKFDLDESTRLKIFQEIINESTTDNEKGLIPIDFERHPDMQFIQHGTIFCVTPQDTSDDESDGDEDGRRAMDATTSSSSSDEDDDVDEEENTMFNFDLFGRFDVSRSKSKPNRYTAEQRTYREIWKQIRHCTAVCQHVDELWTEFTFTIGSGETADGLDESKQSQATTDPVTRHSFRMHRMVIPYSLQEYAVGTTFEYGFENMLGWRWCVILCHGGRFSCGIFEGSREICHRTFSRYVARAKQGKRQMNHLSLGNKSTSAGGQKREMNEKKLHLDIIRTLQEWQQEISSCDLILVHAPGPVNERSIFGTAKEQAKLYGGRRNSVESIRERLDECWKNRHKMGFRLNRDDPRMKRISITTHRPKFSEVKRVQKYYASCALLEATG